MCLQDGRDSRIKSRKVRRHPTYVFFLFHSPHRTIWCTREGKLAAIGRNYNFKFTQKKKITKTKTAIKSHTWIFKSKQCTGRLHQKQIRIINLIWNKIKLSWEITSRYFKKCVGACISQRRYILVNVSCRWACAWHFAISKTDIFFVLVVNIC